MHPVHDTESEARPRVDSVREPVAPDRGHTPFSAAGAWPSAWAGLGRTLRARSPVAQTSPRADLSNERYPRFDGAAEALAGLAWGAARCQPQNAVADSRPGAAVPSSVASFCDALKGRRPVRVQRVVVLKRLCLGSSR